MFVQLYRRDIKLRFWNLALLGKSTFELLILFDDFYFFNLSLSKSDPEELAKRNTHMVPFDKILMMRDRWEDNYTVDEIMNSRRPQK